MLRCHIDAFAAMTGAPGELLYDRMKTAVLGEDGEGVVNYNVSLVALLSHYGALPRACRPYRAKTKGKVERPYRYIRQDFFLGRSFRDLDDLNRQFEAWRVEIANARVHATTRRVVEQHFAEEQRALIAHPAIPYSAVLTVERRISHEGMVSVGGNLYSVPDATRKRVVEVQNHPREVRIFEDGRLIASHPLLEGRNQRRTDTAHRKPVPVQQANPVDQGRRTPPARLLRCRGTAPGRSRIVTELLDRIRTSLVGLRMPRALEALDHTLHPSIAPLTSKRRLSRQSDRLHRE